MPHETPFTVGIDVAAPGADVTVRAVYIDETELTAARARIAKLEAALRLIQAGETERRNLVSVGRRWTDKEAADFAREALMP